MRLGLILAGGAVFLPAALLAACTSSPPAADHPAPPPTAAPASPPPPIRPQLDGRAFPDKALALTWDDGPDADSLALARYLHAQGVSATFFVVGEWIDGLSDEPGKGRGVFETGHLHLPILGDLAALGHRVANHTLNHVLLDRVPAGTVVAQLRENQRRIDPFSKGGMRFFRAPGGAWSAGASAAVDGDAELARLVGPVRWDVDGKDWEGSLHCPQGMPAGACERAAPGGEMRVRPGAMAERYLAAIEEEKHGIVLLHDRVGHVGSGYARAVAEALVPRLVARGFVFVAPVMRFGALEAREGEAGAGEDGGKVEGCRVAEGGVVCARSPGKGRAEVSVRLDGAADAEGVEAGDVNGDGREDLCARGAAGVVCALSDGRAFLRATVWMAGVPAGAAIRLRDVNGDGRADLCVREGAAAPRCALAP